jgi:urease accessory protein
MADGAIPITVSAGPERLAALDARLLVWLSPAFPVGAFAYSHGLEQAAERGWLSNRADLEAWLADLVQIGALHNDLVLLSAAWQATRAGAWPDLADIGELALALQPSAERHLETVTQGNAFRTTVSAAWPAAGLEAAFAALPGDVAYPVALGAAAAAHDLTIPPTALAYGVAFVSSLTSAAIRLSLVGQTDAQRIIAALMSPLESAALRAASATLDDLGGASFRSDLASLAHETQYTRLFRS